MSLPYLQNPTLPNYFYNYKSEYSKSNVSKASTFASKHKIFLDSTNLSRSNSNFLENSTSLFQSNESFWNSTIVFPCLNDSDCGNITNAGDSLLDYRYWTLCLLIFPIFTIFGNCLVVLSVAREKNLKNITNYFIVSLAVADLLVAIFVMPPAVYVEVAQEWRLGDKLCDAWVASDVLGSTASILNLTAISVDRFIAVTYPIKYSKHKSAKRFYIMLALAWVTSLAIAAPIALGVNYSERRETTMCLLYNADFIIYSSMGSFYIPSLIMLILYGKILLVLRQRAKRFEYKKRLKTVDNSTLQTVIENTALTTRVTDSSRLVNDANLNVTSQNQTLQPLTIQEEVTAVATTSDTPDDEENNRPVLNSANAHVISNVCATDNPPDFHNHGYLAPVGVVETQFNDYASSPPEPIFLPNSKKKFNHLSRNGSTKKRSRTTVTKFNFQSRQSKKKDKTSAKREKKATKTLAIVLGVFLVCWVPFFTINIMSAICIRYDLFDRYQSCNLDLVWFSTFVWLGYINSFLNPVIYTIFNPEFRKAFHNILKDPFHRRNR